MAVRSNNHVFHQTRFVSPKPQFYSLSDDWQRSTRSFGLKLWREKQLKRKGTNRYYCKHRDRKKRSICRNDKYLNTRQGWKPGHTFSFTHVKAEMNFILTQRQNSIWNRFLSPKSIRTYEHAFPPKIDVRLSKRRNQRESVYFKIRQQAQNLSVFGGEKENTSKGFSNVSPSNIL